MKELKQDREELEKRIEKMLRSFIEKHGDMDIKLKSQVTYEHFPPKGSSALTGVKVSLNIGI